MTTLPTWFVGLTSVVTIVAGLPYVAKFLSYILLSPDIEIDDHDGPNGLEFHVENKSDYTVKVLFDYHKPHNYDGFWANSDLQLKTFGPTRMPSGSIWMFRPEDKSFQTSEVEITVRPEIRLQEMSRLFPPFWGSVELQPWTQRFEVGLRDHAEIKETE